MYFKLGGGCSWHDDSAAFLFSLVNKPGWQPLKLSQKGQHSAIYRCSHYGPTFGAGHDIFIANNAANTADSTSNLGVTYILPPDGNSYESSFQQSFLAGSNTFRPDEVEVFYETTWKTTEFGFLALHTLFSKIKPLEIYKRIIIQTVGKL